jgi:hypothetical protein
MKNGRSLPLTLALALLLAGGCSSGIGMVSSDGGTNGGGVCQAGQQCCSDEELICNGDPDNGTVVCSCYKDWDCDSNASPTKCSQNPASTPDGKTGWKCSVEGSTESCSKSGTAPSGKNGWSCSSSGGMTVCTRSTNTPDGSNSWSCSYSSDVKTCTKAQTADGGGSSADTGFPPGWNCKVETNGSITCTKTSGDVPPGGGTWSCTFTSGTITCEGTSSTVPGGNGWSCKKSDELGTYRCTKSDSGGQPDGKQRWACVSGSAYGGKTICVLLPPKGSSKECYSGQKMWCDGWTYCGYGQVTCGSNGTWARKTNPKTGALDYDCQELSDGTRPNTVCACYFYKYTKSCCENPDCIVPAGTTGQTCGKSAGKYCDYCNPTTPECVGTDALCAVTASGEHFCAQDCAGGGSCPTGSTCTAVTSDGQTYYQCIPSDGSCYY